jgi:predicted tellurium resistance membrane protein TerC
MMEGLAALASEPAAWVALATLVAMEVVLGVDNLIFISVLSNKLPEQNRVKARRIGIALALGMRLILLASIAWIVQLTAPIFALFGNAFSWRDIILIAGGLFLVWKATKEIHHTIDPKPAPDMFTASAASVGFGAAIGQIILLDLVFSIDSIITAVGMTDNIAIMVIAVIVAVAAMMFAATPLADFIERNPTVVMLALSFLMLIGTTLIAEGFGAHVPKGYVYAAMAFSALVEGLNIIARRRREARAAPSEG